MKVLFVCSGNNKDGINIIIRNQGESLEKEGVDVDYFTIRGKGIASYVKHIFLLKEHLSRNQYDIIHAHYSFSAFTASLAGCKPLVVSLMGSDSNSNIFWKIILKLSARMFWDKTIVKSLSIKQSINIKDAILIPNGINLQKIVPAERSKGFSQNKIIIFVSDPTRHSKNFDLAQKAISLLEDNTILFKVIYSKSHQEVINEINSAHALLLTSRWEGSPNVVKEAMSCNCPVVSTNVGDVKWLFGEEQGYFITSFKPEDVADKIRQAINYSDLYGRTKGRKRIIELGLESKMIARRIIKEYNEVLNNQKKAKQHQVVKEIY